MKTEPELKLEAVERAARQQKRFRALMLGTSIVGALIVNQFVHSK